MPDITIKRRDAGKILSGQLKDANGVPIDCTGNTSRKIFMSRGGVLKINSVFTFSNAATGSWTYTLQTADVDTKGSYYLELEVTLSTGQIMTFPTNPIKDKRYLRVLIQDDLG